MDISDDLIPNPGRHLLAILRALKIRVDEAGLDERRIENRCQSRPCKKPQTCKITCCRRHGTCQLAVLSGWPWPIPGKKVGSVDYWEALQMRYRHIALRREEEAVAAREKKAE
jgi:hypothetical protein